MAHERKLGQLQKDGRSYRDHLKVAAKSPSLIARSAALAELAGPACPVELAYLWDWFCELNNARPSSLSTLSTAQGLSSTVSTVPIGFSDIDAWSRLTGRAPLQPLEVELLRALDRLWLSGPPKEPKEG